MADRVAGDTRRSRPEAARTRNPGRGSAGVLLARPWEGWHTGAASTEEAAAVELSILIVNHNTRGDLERCLASLAAHLPAGLEREILVADNASTDGSAEFVRKAHPGVRLLRLDNRGYSAAVNAAARAARGACLLLLNADIEWRPGAYEALQRTFAESGTAGVAAARQVDASGRPQLTCGPFPALRSELRRRKLQAAMDRGDAAAIRSFQQGWGRGGAVDWASGSCLLIRRETFRDAGWWDENFFLFFEDIDWCRAVHDAGWAVHYVPSAEVFHGHGASMAKVSALAEAAYRQSQCYFALKHKGPAGLLLTRLYLTIKCLAAGIARVSRPLPVRQALAAVWAPVPAPPAAVR